MTRTLFDQPLDLLERRFQALRDQLGAMPEASRQELETALQGLSQAIAALRADGRDPTAAAKAIEESEERFRAIFDAAQDAIFIKDRSLRYTQVNPAMERLLVAVRRRSHRQDRRGTVRGEGGAHIRAEDQRVLNGEVVTRVGYRLVRGAHHDVPRGQGPPARRRRAGHGGMRHRPGHHRPEAGGGGP